MKNTAPKAALEAIDRSRLSGLTSPLVKARVNSPTRANPESHVFTVVSDIDTECLLCHACETLASINVLTTDLACKMEGSRQNVVLAVQQLAVLGELLVNRALDNIAPLVDMPEAPSTAQS
ncbi:hypothetical protein SAMN04490202_4513 [Pseudomonas reinekei]|jgi:hypothetical protein|uniref:DUF3077 domain-containing protein n=1 Tax=Pseudomonas reinekei TaxID=395598 RepID=A0A1H0T6Y0_PSERE|nr:DUF6124 family protein [Pseudomonas reinekei]KAB0483627.1 hypothetical protein F7R15_19925 [Pseudomonas reinekei]OLU00658.1 hypothetical protein BVK86_20885 [Pseudomonas reinekei]SDP49625.1 hypothetical protein SAMN04490202_4513 [Pseudomonas reinekei]